MFLKDIARNLDPMQKAICLYMYILFVNICVVNC